MLSLADAPSHHYSLENVGDCQLGFLFMHLPEQPYGVYACNIGAHPRIINPILQDKID